LRQRPGSLTAKVDAWMAQREEIARELRGAADKIMSGENPFPWGRARRRQRGQAAASATAGGGGRCRRKPAGGSARRRKLAEPNRKVRHEA
jgi:hypothetical protein